MEPWLCWDALGRFIRMHNSVSAVKRKQILGGLTARCIHYTTHIDIAYMMHEYRICIIIWANTIPGQWVCQHRATNLFSNELNRTMNIRHCIKCLMHSCRTSVQGAMYMWIVDVSVNCDNEFLIQARMIYCSPLYAIEYIRGMYYLEKECSFVRPCVRYTCDVLWCVFLIDQSQLTAIGCCYCVICISVCVRILRLNGT